MALAWSTAYWKGDWLAARVHGFGEDVGSFVPHGFESYARVFHPLQGGHRRRWSDLAARNGRIVHPEMQLHLIARPLGQPPLGYEELPEASEGSLPRHELQVLADLLGRYTEAPTAGWFAVWDGYAQLHGSPAVGHLINGREEPVAGLAPAEVLQGPRLELPDRTYLLLHGAVDDATAVFDLLQAQSPNLWWPDDRAWCVATDIDLTCTYVAGSEALIGGVLATADLEALPATLTDAITADGDRINAQLDDVQ